MRQAILIVLLALLGALAVTAYTIVTYKAGYKAGADDTTNWYETDGSTDMSPPDKVSA